MPSTILQGVVEVVLQPIFEFGCYFVGRIVVSIVSLGRIKCDRLTAAPPRGRLRWGGMIYRRGPHLYLSATATIFAGLLFLILLLIGGALISYFKA
jgi:hypothetical protein